MYEDLFRRVSELNEQVVSLRAGGEYMASVHLQEGCIFMLDWFCEIKSITGEQKKALIEELQKR